ncbi:GrpB family protein [Devosia sp. SL43]|nr:GrpB family protein [Devosia sp. SL43]
MKDAIVLVAFDSAWAETYAQARDELLSLLPVPPLLIEHFGSTSVPGLWQSRSSTSLCWLLRWRQSTLPSRNLSGLATNSAPTSQAPRGCSCAVMATTASARITFMSTRTGTTCSGTCCFAISCAPIPASGKTTPLSSMNWRSAMPVIARPIQRARMRSSTPLCRRRAGLNGSHSGTPDFWVSLPAARHTHNPDCGTSRHLPH